MLAATWAAVTPAVRDTAVGGRIAEEIAETTGNPRCALLTWTLLIPRRFGPSLPPGRARCTVLVNNAGVMACPE